MALDYIIYTTPGNYTWVCPAGVSSVEVVAIGAGGGSDTNGYGGGGGAVIYGVVPVSPGVGYNINVGLGGYNKVHGGNTSFTSSDAVTTVVQANGGKTGKIGLKGGSGGTFYF
ncbi:MAG: hypothetical protein EBU90_27835, partial [Proteobacteria bacterium]|nr:hypothetical protein [Pseudomonadota bacterium]